MFEWLKLSVLMLAALILSEQQSGRDVNGLYVTSNPIPTLCLGENVDR